MLLQYNIMMNLQQYGKLMDVRSAKLASFILVLVLIAWQGLNHLLLGNDSCNSMLTAGRKESAPSWQAHGCMMHQYNKKQAQNCLNYVSFWGGKNHIAFVGDSRIRELYLSFVNIISTEDIKLPEGKHKDIHYHSDMANAKVDFYWQPFINKNYTQLLKSWRRNLPSERPNLVITGSGPWTIKYLGATNQAFNSFQDNLTEVVPEFSKMKNSTQILWMVQDPVIEDELKASRKMITNSEMDKYNRAAVNILSGSSAVIWSSSRLVAESFDGNSEDGLHMGPVVTNIDSQMLLNLYCNRHTPFKDGTCCGETEPVSRSQKLTASFFLTCIFITALWHIIRLIKKKSAGGLPILTEETVDEANIKEGSQTFIDNIATLAKFGMIMGYFYLCDRTDFFMKENKHFSPTSFLVPLFYIVILGVHFSKISDKFQDGCHGNEQFLHRDQSDEWKGWLQLIILLYHITGASKILPIYVSVRMLVGSYLFLSGYGHFSFFYTKGDYSFHRFCTVLFRMNFQVVAMCLVMGRPYQFYYFVPLVSYWFIVVYVTMAIWPQVTKATTADNVIYYFYVLLKMIIMGITVALLHSSEVIFERIFLAPVIKGLFISSNHTVDEWRFRWQLDRYMTISGMLFAFIIHIGRRHKFFDDTEVNTIKSRRLLFICSVAVCGLVGHIVFAFICGSKSQCNEIHPYISHIPIISFLLLRNISGYIRIRYSYFFAWFGRISLELFISQYHIWLAADTHGILVLIPGFPIINLLVTSFIFVCCAHELSQLTARLTSIFVPVATGHLVRNASLFLAFLIAMATAYGFWGV